MKIAKVILAGAIAVASVSAARADVTVYITGATAYRSPAVSAIKSYLSGGFVGIYGAKSGVTSENNASNIAFRGTVSGAPTNIITIKACWAGSVGGIKLIQNTTTFNVNDQPGAKGWIPDAALPAGNSGGTITAGTEGSTTIVGADSNTYTFESGASAAKPDAAFSDAFQSSALGGASGDALPLGGDGNGRIGAIPFDWVVCNGVTPSAVTVLTGVTYTTGASSVNFTTQTGATLTSGQYIGGQGIPRGTKVGVITGNSFAFDPTTTTTTAGAPSTGTITAADNLAAPINNITTNQANQIMVSGGRLPMFTGASTDSGLGVYCYGRNADSGTRISALGESGRGITARPGFHLQPTFTPAGTGNGAGGSPALKVSNLKQWPLETVLGTTYTPGQGGFNSGGDLADALLAPGSTLATVNSPVTRPGWMIGYLGRSDSNRACASTFGQNTAKRLTFNGEQDWNGANDAINPDGTPIGGYNDNAVREGHYTAWEFEHFYKKASTPAPESTILDALASSIISAPAASGTIQFSTLHVTRSVEGGTISYP